MSTTTTNFGLIKPELTDAADITTMNTNWDTIDEKLKELGEEVSTDSIIEQNKGNEQKFWVGTKSEYDAVATKDPNTSYVVTDEDDIPSLVDLTGVLPMGQGGTNAPDGATGLKNLLAAGATVLSSYQYGTELPTAGVKGRIFFKVVG